MRRPARTIERMTNRPSFGSASLILLLAACGSSGSTAGAGGASASNTSAGPGASTGSGTQSSSASSSSGAGGQSGVGHFVGFTNKCSETIWVGALNAAQYPLPENGGFKLDPGQSHTITLPEKWGGRF